jgi:hypothetical protein
MKKRITGILLAVLLLTALAVPAFAAEGKTVTDRRGNITVTNVLKETTILFYEEECPVYWVPDTGTTVTYLGMGDIGDDQDDLVVLSYWVIDNGKVTEVYADRSGKDQLRSDGTYNIEFWLNAEEQKYPEFYDDNHLTLILYRDSRIYIGFVKSETPAPALTAKPTASKVLVNGASKSFDAYNISDNNYFKLRDLAYVLNGTEKQFAIGYDAATKAITLTSGQAYTPVGGELTGKGDGVKTPKPTASKIYLDGKEVSFTVYIIEGNNYFKLRDVGEAFDFGVNWDGANQTIVIDTSKGYTPG